MSGSRPSAFFNSANLNGLAAILLSWGIGAWPGTLVFALAVVIGTYNKARPFTPKEDTNPWLKHWSDPSLTAKILMLAAALNCATSCFEVVMGAANERLYHTLAAFAWGFGVAGDDALRRNDRANFTAVDAQNYPAGWRGALFLAARNPSFYYLAVNIFMGGATLLKSGTEVGTLPLVINVLVTLISLAGMGYCIWRAYLAYGGKIEQHQINDGVVNHANVLTNTGIGTIALIGGHNTIFLAQFLFCLSNIRAIQETRRALKREYKS